MAILNQFNFSGGQNSKVSPLLLANNECEIIQNYHLDNVGSLTKRNGIANVIGQIVDAKPILGMYVFNDKLGTDRSNILVAIDDSSSTNSDIFAVESNAWAISETDDTAGATPVFTTFVDYVFRTNGSNAMSSSADPRPTGGSWGTTNCLATLIPKYCCVWEDRVYALNDNSGTKYPSRIYWSSLPSGTPLALTWTSASDYADINPDDNDEITWGEPFGPRLLIFKENAMYRWTFGQVEPDKIIDVGTPQGLTVKQTHGICFFANKYGVWAYQAGQPQLISRKMQPWIDAIATLTNMRAEVDNDHYYLYIGDVTVDSVAYANVMLVYTISLKAWHIETYPFEIRSMARFQRKTLGSTEIYDSIYLGDDDGFIYRKDTGTSDYLGTTAQPISGLIRTKEYPLAFPNAANLENLNVIAQQATGIETKHRIDRAQDFKSWKDLKERITSGRIGGRAKTFQLEFTDNSQTASRIEGFALDFKTEDEKRRKE